MQPLISVIVPVYNGEQYLKNCIESIAAQTYESIEMIVINDGSTDGTAAVCEKLRMTYGNLRYITTEDLGVSASRNNGIRQANGEYVTFVDADDRIHPQMLQRLYDAMIQTQSDVAGCGFGIWKTEQEWKVLAKSVAVTTKADRLYQNAKDYVEQEILQGNSRCWSKLYKKSVLDQLKEHIGVWFMEDLTIGEDMLFLIHLLPEAVRLVEIDFKGYGYYQNPQGAMNRTFRPQYMDQIRCWELAREQVKRLAPESENRVTSILLMSVMLTAGKLSALPWKLRRQNRNYVQRCQETLLREKQNREAVKLLSKGYRFKVRFFMLAPQLYLWCYHLRKQHQ